LIKLLPFVDQVLLDRQCRFSSVSCNIQVSSNRLLLCRIRWLLWILVEVALPFRKYLSERRFLGRSDCEDFGSGNKYALVSRRFFYFGRNALLISDLPDQLAENIAKGGVGFRSDYPPQKLKKLVSWFAKNYETGMHGDPCGTKRNTLKARRRIACG
jgi:hypothetical protein